MPEIEKVPTHRLSVSTITGTTRSSSWSTKDDQTLIQARVEGLNWNQIGPKHFPSKTPNACRKRHERLMERENDEQWNGVKLEVLAQAYMEVRQDMWSIIAARVGEKWQLVETKCMEKGLKNLVQASRNAQKKLKGGRHHDNEDSGIGITDLEEQQEDHHRDSKILPKINSDHSAHPSYVRQYPQRLPSVESLLTIPSLLHSKHHPQQSSGVVYSIHHLQFPTQDREPIEYVDTMGPSKSHAKVTMSGSASLNHTSMAGSGDQSSIAQEKVETPTRMKDSFEEHFTKKEDMETTSPANLSTGDVLDQFQATRTGHIICSGAESIPSSNQWGFQSQHSDLHPEFQSNGDPLKLFDGSLVAAPTQPENESLNELKQTPREPDFVRQESTTACKEMLDRLILHFHDIFTARGFTMQNWGESSETSGSSKHSSDKSQGGSNSRTVKRGLDALRADNEQGYSNNDDDDDENDSRKRRRNSDRPVKLKITSHKRFACPYFKHNPFKDRASRACSGPGFLTIAKVKDHLYRVHHLPPHCQRCFTTFEHETQLIAHTRSLEACAVTNAKPIEGFNNEQLLKLKNKKSMHRADDEENQWRFVYYVLFPETELFDFPSPYYDYDGDVVAPPLKQISPKPPDLTQFDAFLCRELPRKVRKAYEATMENADMPMEETLRNEIENIVKRCLQSLSRIYLDSVRTSATHTAETITQKQVVSTSSSRDQVQDPRRDSSVEAENLCYPQSDLVPSFWHDFPNVSTYSNFAGGADLANGAYESLSDLLQSSLFDSTWLDTALVRGNALETTQVFEFAEPAKVQHDTSDRAKEWLGKGAAAN